MKTVLLGTALWLLAAAGALAQTAPEPLTFEIASVKPAAKDCAGPCPMMVRYLPGGGFRAEGMTLKFLIGFAYNVRDFQITGGPAWINSDRYEINARPETSDEADKLPDDPTKASDKQRKTFTDRMSERIRNLLADRFQLVLHRETKEQQVYALVVAKGGPKFQETKDGKGMMRMGPGMLTGQGVGLDMLANTMSTQLRRPVIDKTGLSGTFDFELKWTPDPSQMPQLPPGPPPPGVQLPPPPDPNGPSIFTAVQEQLGLRLESQKGPVEILVIDRAEKPSEN
jgi:bla regulator protein blaR1